MPTAFGIDGLEHGVELLRLLADAVHVMVIDRLDAELRRAPADGGEQPAEPRVIGRDQRALRPLVDDLERAAAGGTEKLRVLEVHGELARFLGRIDAQVSARQDGERQLVSRQQILQLVRRLAVALEGATANLDCGEAGLGDLAGGLFIVAAPGDGRIADAHRWRIGFGLSPPEGGHYRRCGHCRRSGHGR